MPNLWDLDHAPVGSTLTHASAGSVYTKREDGRWHQQSDGAGAHYSSRDFLGGFTNQLYEGYTFALPASELDTYKQRVREVAERYARDNGWCDVVEKALEELDIPKPVKVWKVGDEVSRGDLEELPVGTMLKGGDGRLRVVMSNKQYVAPDTTQRSNSDPRFRLYQMPVRQSTIVYLPKSR